MSQWGEHWQFLTCQTVVFTKGSGSVIDSFVDSFIFIHIPCLTRFVVVAQPLLPIFSADIEAALLFSIADDTASWSR